MSRRSVRSSRSPPTGAPSSILKKPRTTLKGRLSEAQRLTPKVKFSLPYCQKVQNILKEYAAKQQSRDYENILCLIRDSEMTDDEVSALLREATACVSLLNADLRLFVEAILSVKWSCMSREAVAEYQSFILNLLSAHNYHAKLVIEKLVKLFMPDMNDADWLDGDPPEDDFKKCSNIHSLLKSLLEVVPMCKELVLETISSQFPYYNKPTHTHEYYIYNVLSILTYQPSFQPVILELLFSKLIMMDLNAPKEEIEKSKLADEEMFPMDFDTRSVLSSSTAFTKVDRCELARCLDVCLEMIFGHVFKECHDAETNELNVARSQRLFEDMVDVFEEVILPTYDTHHVQFVLFYLCSFKTSFAEGFVTFLWKFAHNPNKAPVLRQAAVNYLASFCARANYVKYKLLKVVLQDLSDWIHAYISKQDEMGAINSDVRVHRVFYSMCQAVFYIVAFRHRNFVDSKKRITFLQNLNTSGMVTSKLNPFRVCQATIVQNFAAIARNYQLAYCYSVIEHNSRNKLPIVYQGPQGTLVTSDGMLDSVFPFDPYLLEKSGGRIRPLYREYQEYVDETSSRMEMEADTDDFLFNHEGASSSNTRKFSYSTSPGFFKN